MSTTYAPSVRLGSGAIDLRGAWMGGSAWSDQNARQLDPSTLTAGSQARLAGFGTALSGAVRRLVPAASLVTTSGITQGIEQALKTVEDLGVTLEEVADLRSYLRDHADMLEAMQATVAVARDRLPGGTAMALRLYRDPEIDDEYLAMYARPPVLDLETLKTTLDDIARRRAPAIRGRSGRILVLPDFSAA